MRMDRVERREQRKSERRHRIERIDRIDRMGWAERMRRRGNLEDEVLLQWTFELSRAELLSAHPNQIPKEGCLA